MTRRKAVGRIPLGQLTLLAAMLLLGLIPIVQEAGPLAALPLLALVLPLLLGRFPGESVIERLASGVRPARRRAPARPPRPRPGFAHTLLRARLLIAASLAERPPPAAASI